jgi:RNA-directed DNA polymerase
VEVPCDEGGAIHIDPESCTGGREAAGEALTGARVGQPLSGERLHFRGADAFQTAEGNMVRCDKRAARRSRVVVDTGMRVSLLYGKQEVSVLPAPAVARAAW